MGREESVLHLLFVCTGNICRSPTAERLASLWLRQYCGADFSASSAGTRAVIGHPIHHEAAVVLEGMGGDTSNFAARQLTPKIAAEADLILTMTKAHRDAVLEMAPRKLRQTFTLGEAARLAVGDGVQEIADLAALRANISGVETSDVPDPIGQGAKIFEGVGAQIAALLLPVLELCRRSAERRAD